MNEEIILELQDVSKKFNGLQAVNHVSFQVKSGTITTMIGPNGAGKSTAFDLISGLENVTSGNIRFGDNDITNLDAYKRCQIGIGRIFQIPKIFTEMTVLENAMVGLHGRTRSGVAKSGFRMPGFRKEEKSIWNGALEKLDFVGLKSEKDRMASTLSFGNQRLLEFARALATDPKLLLLDEPTAGLTPAETEKMGRRLFDVKKMGVTVLIVEHNLRFIMSIADKIIVLHYGRKIYDGLPASLKEDSKVIEAYIGTR